MAYEDYDLSVDSSQPDELFLFEYDGDGSRYTITSSAYDVDFQANTYKAVPVSRSNIQSTSEIGKNGVTVKVDRDNIYFLRHLAGSLSYNTVLTIFSMQPDTSYVQAWKGVVKSVTRTTSNIEVVTSPISTSANRPIIHRKYQVQCPHALYSYYCGVNKSMYSRSGVLTSASSSVLTSTTFAAEVNGWFVGGDITINHEKRMIIAHTGDTVSILDAFYGVSAGDPFTATAGCSHLISDCDSKFSNHLNYGGCPWIPSDDDLTKGKSFTY